tara:strand:- start:2464 stop:4413 length:1950 start_codon:yes stop_codon:yes gene_type:complete
MKLKITILFSIFSLHSFAQSKVLDSLLKVSEKQSGEVYVNTLNEISWEYKNSNIDSALSFARKSLIASKKIDDKKVIASSYNSLANCFEAIGKLDSATIYHQKGLDIKLQIGHIVGAADSYNNLGIVYDLKGDFALSLENYFKALKIYEEEKDVPLDKLPMVLGNIGIVYKKQKEYTKVLDYYKRALKLYETNNNNFGIVVIKGNIGSVLINTKDFEDSIKYSEEAKELYAKLGYDRYVPYMLNNIAIAKDSLKQYKESQKDYREAIQLFKKDQNLYELTYAQIGLARSLIKEKRVEEAAVFAKEALKISQEKGFKEFEIDANKILAIVESEAGNYKKAFKYYEEYAIGKDSLFEDNKTKTVFELETKYETAKKEKEIAQQKEQILKNELDIKNKNLFALLLGSALLIFTIISFGLYKRQQHKKREFSNQIALKEAQTYSKLQDQRLRISRDLHDNIGSQLTFIISSIDNLKFLTDTTNEKLRTKLSEINQFAGGTISQLRDTIWAMNKNEISFEDLQSRILTFIEKAKLATNNAIQFNFYANIKSIINFSSIKGVNIFRVIQEAINNSVKYANATGINITITETKDEIEFVVTDNGTGFDLTKIQNGNGLENMQKRINEVGGTILINSQPNKGTSIKIVCSKNKTNAV